MQKSELLENVLAHLDQGVLMADSGLNIIYYNNRLLEVFDLDEDFITKNKSLDRLFEAVYGKDSPEALQKKNDARLRSEAVLEINGPGGTVLEVRHKPLAGGGLVRTYTDITERRKSEDRLRESRSRYRTLVDNFPNGAVVLFDHDMRFLFAGGLGLAETGLAADEMVGKTIHEVFPPETVEIVKPLYERTFRGEEISAEVPFADRIFDCRHVPLLNDAGQVKQGMVVTQDVTLKRQNMNALQEAKERWRSLVQNAPDIIITVDREGRIQTVDNLPEENPDPKLYGASILDFIPDPMHRKIAAKALENVFENGETGFYEVITNDRKGIPGWYESRVSPLKKDGLVKAAVLITRNITHRKRIEEELRNSQRNLEKRVRYRTEEYVAANQRLLREIESRKRFETELKNSEERYRAMFHSNQAVKLLIDADTGAIVEANEAACEFYGYTMEEIHELNIADINALSPDHLRQEMEAAACLDKRHFNFKHRKKNGRFYDVEVHTSPIRHKGRTLLFSIIQDVTKRTEAEIALKESEHRYRALFNNAADAIVVHDMRGKILDVNKVACERFGMTRKELRGINLASFYLPEFNKKASRIRKTLREHGSIYFEGIQKLPDGKMLPIEVNAKVIPYRGRLAVMSVSRDLSERKKNEAMLKQMTSRLISVQEEERKRIGRELHDQLCQNLTAVKVLLESQIRRVPEGFDDVLCSNLKKTVMVLQDSVAEIRRIIMNLRPTVLDDMGLPAAINWLCNEMEKLHPHISVLACISVQDQDCSEEVKTVLFRTIQEALNNAGKHSFADSVRIECTKLDEEIRLVVRDNGIGFSQENVSAQGLGLHGMRERIEPLGGSIRVESARGEGTSIHVTIPLSENGMFMPVDVQESRLDGLMN